MANEARFELSKKDAEAFREQDFEEKRRRHSKSQSPRKARKPVESPEERSHIELFRSVLNELSPFFEKSSAQIANTLRNHTCLQNELPFDEYSSLYERYVTCWNTISNSFSSLSKISEANIPISPVCKSNLTSFRDYFIAAQIDDASQDISSLSNSLIFAWYYLNALSTLFKDLDSNPNLMRSSITARDLQAAAALKDFVERGQGIRDDPEFKHGVLKKIESIMANQTKNMPLAVKSQIGRSQFNFDQTFLAFAAPSMEGKTQFAFTIRDFRPLYFPMCEANDSKEDTSPQPIYLNYSNLAGTLSACARADLKAIKSLKLAPSATEISKKFSQTKSFTVGFLMELIKQSRSYRPLSGMSWMEFHSNRKEFSFPSASITDLYNLEEFANVRKSGAKYALFLDEFLANEENRFVRNLARALKLPCVVANTNTKVTNLVDPIGARSSGSGARSAWSFVVTRLGKPSLFVLNKKFMFNESINKLIKSFKNRKLCKFLEDLRDVQIHNSRPGVASFVAEILQNLATSFRSDVVNFTLGQFLDFLCNRLAEMLKARKQSLSEDLAAHLAQIALLQPEAFFGFKGPASEDAFKLWRQKRFLKDHLFYLINPVNPSSNFFLTFRTLAMASRAARYRDCAKTRLSILSGNNFREWSIEYCAFRPEEFLTLCGCLFVASIDSIRSIYALDDEEMERESGQNQVELYRSGNALEAKSSSAITRASHYSVVGSSPRFSFSGQGGDRFVKNIVFELLSEAVTFDMAIKFPRELASFLQSLKIPFLYSVNRKDKIFDKFSSADDGFFVQEYQRTGKKSQIYGHFQALRLNRPANSKLPKFANVSVGCKNYSDKIDAVVMKKIVDRFEKAKTELGIVICRSAIGAFSPESKFADKCYESNYQVFRLKTTAVNKISFIPANTLSQESKMTIIIIETSDD